ncbi:MAG: hypothetical protein QOF17_510 [Solirubrobacteraceae bacterium]|jgi:hypothetical protein|nr:hypothetical protein [Solirubrobacteraceae bacterium]
MAAAFPHLDAVDALLRRAAGALGEKAAGGASASLGRDLFPDPFLTAGTLLWPWEHAATVLRAWAAWTREAPDDVTSAGRLLRFPALPVVPAPLRGRALVAVEVAIPGEPWMAAGHLAPLTALAPETSTVAIAAPESLPALHTAVDVPAPAVGGHLALGGLPAEAVEAFVATAGPGSGSNLLMASLRHLGAAYGMAAVGIPATGGDVARIGIRLSLLEGRLAPFAAGRRPPAARPAPRVS